MTKQECIHIHRFLDIVRTNLIDRGEVQPAAFDDYFQYGVRPSHVHQQKDKHKVAIRKLLQGISEGIDEEIDTESPKLTP